MSDPVTNAEIEDVLSSIRRLVSDDARSLARSRPLTQPVEPERLVLTPALRVAPELVEQAAPEPEFVPDTGAALAPSGEAVVAVPADESEAVGDDVSEDQAPEKAETQDANSADTAAADMAAGDTAADPWADPKATLYEAAAAYGDADQDDGAAPQIDESQSDESLSDDPEPYEAGTDRVEAEVEDVTVQLADGPGDLAEMDGVTVGPASKDDQEAGTEPDLSGAVEVLSAAIAETDEDWEPDGGWEPDGSEAAAMDVPHVETLDWQDAAPQTGFAPADGAMAAHQTDQTDEAAFPDDSDESDLFTGDDLVMDEAMLREIVTDIVREELQGALGERITRNVRKLVRREINRALSVQELE